MPPVYKDKKIGDGSSNFHATFDIQQFAGVATLDHGRCTHAAQVNTRFEKASQQALALLDFLKGERLRELDGTSIPDARCRGLETRLAL